MSDQKIFCFGSNFFGQFGVGTRARQNDIYAPEIFGTSGESLNPSDIDDIQCGSQFTAVLKKNGQVIKTFVVHVNKINVIYSCFFVEL